MSQPLKDVPGPADLRDLILSEWENFREFRGADSVPSELRCTSWAGDDNKSPSHARGRALDIVTELWPDRRYLVEFSVWLAVRNPQLNAIVYRRTYQPHVHISDVGFGGGGAASSIGINGGDAKTFTVYKREQWPSKAADIIRDLKNVSDSYPNGVTTDWEYWKGVLEGTEQLGGNGFFGKVKEFLKKRWYWIVLPLGLAVVVWLIMRSRQAQEE